MQQAATQQGLAQQAAMRQALVPAAAARQRVSLAALPAAMASRRSSRRSAPAAGVVGCSGGYSGLGLGQSSNRSQQQQQQKTGSMATECLVLQLRQYLGSRMRLGQPVLLLLLLQLWQRLLGWQLLQQAAQQRTQMLLLTL